MVGMDLIGKLSKTDNGNQYICVMIDYRTRWAQAYPMKQKNAVEVTNCLLKFVYQFEVPKRILTDNGREFVNNVSKVFSDVNVNVQWFAVARVTWMLACLL